MANKFGIPPDVELRIRKRDKRCVYCGKAMKKFSSTGKHRGDMATIEHLRELGPFYWVDGLKEKDLAICCGSCNSSRGRKSLRVWFKSQYCIKLGITGQTVSRPVRGFLRRQGSHRLG